MKAKASVLESNIDTLIGLKTTSLFYSLRRWIIHAYINGTWDQTYPSKRFPGYIDHDIHLRTARKRLRDNGYPDSHSSQLTRLSEVPSCINEDVTFYLAKFRDAELILSLHPFFIVPV